MTATITVVTAERHDVLRVPNAALRYHPSAPEHGPVPHAGAHAGRDHDSATPEATADTPDHGAVFALRDGHPRRVRVTVGITDGVNTEVDGPGLAAGQDIVIDETDAATGQPRANSPRMRMF
jgi:HlyD family secretion protein